MLLAVTMFSSCDKDEHEFRKARIIYPATIPVPPTGIVNHSIELGYEWVEVEGGKCKIEDITYRMGSIVILKGSLVRELIFSLKNSDVRFGYTINHDRGTEIDDVEPGIRIFYNEVVELIRRDGYATIYINGYSEPIKPIELDIVFDVDAYVRY